MTHTTNGKRTAKVKLSLTKRTVEGLQPADKPWIAWDDRLIGFGVRVQPSGAKSFILNYRIGSGGRKARNRRIAIGRCGRMVPEDARRLAQELLGRVARGQDPAQERADSRGMPTLREAFAEYLTVNPNRKRSTEVLYEGQMRYCLGDWLARPLDTITRRDVEARFHRVSQRNGWAVANHIIALLRSVYRRPCVDHEALRNPVDLWLAGGGRYHRAVRRRISTPAETLPRWWEAIEAEVAMPATRDIFWFGMYTGMRRGEIVALSWDRVDLERRIFRVEATKTGEPLELPITRQLAALFERRREPRAGKGASPWVFPSSGGTGHVVELQHLYHRISRAAGTKFWFHGLRNVFITVAERELMLPRSLTKRLVNHARGSDVTESYAADWSVEQLREPAQRIADRIDELAHGVVTDRVQPGYPWPAPALPVPPEMRFGIAHGSA
ncbi:MAG: integrase family protein [Acidobacteria bacterium]|nr:integrase family protein [Acidobacteriota bacterium]MYK80850.1 integrase family protein [Acidobacteriota bacterium]